MSSHYKCCGFALPCPQEQFKKHVEHLQKKSRRSKIHVACGFYSKDNMKKKLGWDQWGPHALNRGFMFERVVG